MKFKGVFELIKKNKQIKISKDELVDGFNSIDNFIIKYDLVKGVEYVINKTCDHAGGKMILKGEQAICPMHGWKLNLENLIYNDSHIKKEKIPFLWDGEQLLIDSFTESLVNPFFDTEKVDNISFRWLNHATIYIECNGVSFITDPWLFGPAFVTGWWLSNRSTIDSIVLLEKVDYVYVSHNHPDHLHPETLSVLSKDTKFIVGDFISKSCETYLNSLGFKNVYSLSFNSIYELALGFDISILKSGDFRDDSGIYICANNHQLLLTVDCNFLNSYVLPQNIDVLMTSFAGGASGFPLCYDNYSLVEKLNISKRNKSSSKISVLNHVKHTKAKYYIPYAGMFYEASERDEFILHNNLKNSAEEYEKLLIKQPTEFIYPSNDRLYNLVNHVLKQKVIKVEYLEKEDINFYINKYKEEFVYNENKIIQYFKSCSYKANQILQIIPTDDSFKTVVGSIIFVDFSKQEYKIISEEQLILEKQGFRVMKMYVRSEIIACVVENQLPWEDLSIGFQMRVERFPNVYESDFWYYFTNEYINKKNFRYSSYCGSCSVVNQNPIWNKK